MIQIVVEAVAEYALKDSAKRVATRVVENLAVIYLTEGVRKGIDKLRGKCII